MAFDASDERAVRLAQNEAHYRRLNEEIRRAAARFDGAGARFAFVCECSDLDCNAMVELTTAEYAHVRSNDLWFAVRPGHEDLSVERPVTALGAVRIVEKVGVGGAVAAALDAHAG